LGIIIYVRLENAEDEKLLQERIYWLAWSRISGLGPVLLRRLEQNLGNLEIAWKANAVELVKVEGFGYKTVNKVIEERSRINPENLYLQHEKENPFFWTPADGDYPRLLLETPSPPPLLYYRGEVEQSENSGQKPLIAIVGTRKPTEYGVRWTRKITTLLANNGFTIVSGMAEGIDSETHKAALKAGARTIAVVGTGVDIVYPAQNKALYKEILVNGLVLSEYPGKTPPDRSHFPARNRIIAGLSRAVLVMEAPIKSGALITARYANEFGRDVYVLPGRIDDEESQGCLKLLSQGANPILDELDELLKSLGAIPSYNQLEKVNIVENLETKLPVYKQQTLPIPNLSPELQKIIDVITGQTLSFDLIIKETGLDSPNVSAALLELELMGLVSQLPGMRYQRL
jgi:DNA processing protein